MMMPVMVTKVTKMTKVTKVTKSFQLYLVLGLRQLPATRPAQDGVKAKISSSP